MFINDVKVRVGKSRFYYHDVVVVCGPVDVAGSVIRNPWGGTPHTRVPVSCPESVLTLDEIYEGTGVD